MSLTRTHIAFLAIISVFTGLIGPGTHAGSELLAYLMTDVRWLAYGILIALILAFAFAAIRRWSLYKICVILISLGIIGLALLTAMGHVSSTKTGALASGMGWGWIFLFIGTLLLFLSYRKTEVVQDETTFSDVIDTIIGMVGGFALACIAGILILSSLSFFSRGQSHDILKRMYVSGEISTLSGGIRAVTGSETMPFFVYDRGADSLLTVEESLSGSIWKLIHEGDTSTGVLKPGLTPLLLDNTLYGIDKSGYVYSGGKILLGSRISEGSKAIVYKNAGVIEVIHQDGKYTIPGKGIMNTPIVLSGDQSTLVWTEGPLDEKHIFRNGKPLGNTYKKVERIDVSRSGQSVMAIVSEGSGAEIVKNGIIVGPLPLDMLSGSYISNGAHSLFITEKEGIKKVVHDMEVISRDLQEVRETFVEEDGGSYAYFGRPIGETTYCIFTRYRGNLCGLEGYMNPTLGADGGSILFAGKKDGIWNIYRNTDVVVSDTGYNAKNIDYDYAFFDPTNPRTYLFIEKDTKTGLYSYRKNGSLLPGTWKDVSTNVSFGYDNHILTTAKDESGWKILEL